MVGGHSVHTVTDAVCVNNAAMALKDCKDVNVDMPCAWQPKRFDSVRLTFCSASSRTGISVVLEAS